MGSVIKADLIGLHKPDADVYLVHPESSTESSTGRPRLTPEQTAAEIIRNAETEAERILAEAERDRETVRSAARKEGYNAGLRELDAKSDVLDKRMGEVEGEMQSRMDEFYSASEPELLKLAVEIAGQIVRRKIEIDEEFVLGNIKAGLKQLRERSEIRIRVNPADYELTRSKKDDIAQSCDGIRSLAVTDDRRVERGGCIIESPNGELDARIETQLGEIERAVLEAAHDGRNQTGSNAQ